MGGELWMGNFEDTGIWIMRGRESERPEIGDVLH